MKNTKGIWAAMAVTICGLSGCFSLRSVEKVHGQGGTIAVSPSHHFKARDMALGWMIENCHPRLPAVIREGLVAGSQKDGKPEWRITYECRDSNAVTTETPAAPAAPVHPRW